MGRPSKPIISRERAARAALKVIDKEGIEGLSLQLVAKKIGVKAPSLYYHFKNKAEILAAVARLLLTDAKIENEDEYTNWRDAQLALAVATRRSILCHPNAAPLILQFFPRRLLLNAYDRWAGKNDLPAEMHMIVLEGLENLTFGSALFAARSLSTKTASMPEFPAEKYPYLDEALKTNQLDEEEMFIEIVRRFLYSF
ncbi:TetR/AcrR family transcriptional regulator [Zhongshania sp. BJYM1]|uniref:TetR/AcrR family transcriptional regulator n=1 Tax=Zhongshania aquatica TaxID=2965069 RepID=UPI0022B5BC9C|nr:TetR family transcriptional regulator [Marortus sp. BJYM1]